MMITEEGFSIHTFELTKELDYETYRRIKNAAYKRLEHSRFRIFERGDKTYIGIYFNNVISIYMTAYEGIRPSVSIKVNLRYIDGIDDAAKIFNYSEECLRQSINKLNEMLLSLDNTLAFNSLILSRVDLCVNVSLDNSDETAEVLRLIKKTKIPGKYMLQSFSGEDASVKNKRSFRIENGNIAFTVYDKVFQIFERGYDKYCDDLDPDGGLLRFEVSLKRRKLRKMSEKQGGNINNYGLLSYLCSNSKNIMKGYIFKIFPRGIYCRYSVAEGIIKKAYKNQKLGERMLYLLIKVSECKGLNRAMELTTDKFELSERQQEKLLESFERIGINPVTIKNSSSICDARLGVREMLV